MKVGISTKVIISVTGIFVAGFIGFKATQRLLEVKPTKTIRLFRVEWGNKH